MHELSVRAGDKYMFVEGVKFQGIHGIAFLHNIATLVLVSYSQPVACCQLGTNRTVYIVETNHSKTTKQHIKDFKRRMATEQIETISQQDLDCLVLDYAVKIKS